MIVDKSKQFSKWQYILFTVIILIIMALGIGLFIYDDSQAASPSERTYLSMLGVLIAMSPIVLLALFRIPYSNYEKHKKKRKIDNMQIDIHSKKIKLSTDLLVKKIQDARFDLIETELTNVSVFLHKNKKKYIVVNESEDLQHDLAHIFSFYLNIIKKTKSLSLFVFTHAEAFDEENRNLIAEYYKKSLYRNIDQIEIVDELSEDDFDLPDVNFFIPIMYSNKEVIYPKKYLVQRMLRQIKIDDSKKKKMKIMRTKKEKLSAEL